MAFRRYPSDFADPPSLAQIAAEIAAARLALAVLRHTGELKYREDQVRIPKGSPGPGRFADEGRGTSHRAVSAARMVAPAATRVVAGQAGGTAARAAVAGASALSPTGVVAGAAAAGAPLAVGAMGVSRAAGLNAHYTTGVPVTPFLHIPGEADDLTPPLQRGRVKLTPDEQTERDDQCEEQLRSDDIKCQTYAAMYGKGKKGRARIAAVCKSTAMDRYAECLVDGPASVRTPLFTGR